MATYLPAIYTLHNGFDHVYIQGTALPVRLRYPRTQLGIRPANRRAPPPPQTLIVPALIALLVFLVATYVLYPLWSRYRSSRYGAYLPLDTITTGTLSLRHRLQNAAAAWLVPATWRDRLQDRLVVAVHRSSSSDTGGFDSDEGEELDEVPEDEDMRARLEREARRSQSSGRPDLERRLSRE